MSLQALAPTLRDARSSCGQANSKVLPHPLPQRPLPVRSHSGAVIIVVLDMEIPPPPAHQVNLVETPVPGLEGELVAKVDDGEHHQQDVRVYKPARVERGERRPPLDKGEDDVGNEPEPRVERVPDGPEGQLARGVALDCPGLAEADVCEGDGAPDLFLWDLDVSHTYSVPWSLNR